MRFFVEDSAREFEQGLRILLEERGHGLAEGGNAVLVRWEKGSETELRAGLTGGVLQITCGKKTHFFRGFMKSLMYLEKHPEIPEGGEAEYAFRERAWFQSEGLMLDCSRNGVLNSGKVMEYIRRMAALGLNRLMLYTEETYEIPGRPYFGAFRGRYTQEELRGFDSYAELFGIEMIPCIQTLAHLHTALRWKAMEGFRDTGDILLAGSEEVYRLIDDMIGSAAASFKSRKIHLGMDEAHELGLGRYLALNGYQNRFEIMSRHLERVTAICKKYGLEPMIWSDMYFRLKSPAGDYYDLPPATDFSDSPKPPQDITMVYWDYYHDKKEHYKNYINLHRKLSEKLIFAGGGWIWNGVAPNYSCMEATLGPALEACRENGVDEVICTFWQDNGAETPMEAGNLPMALFAEAGFAQIGEAEAAPGMNWEKAADFMEFLWGDSLEAWRLLDRFDRVPGVRGNNLDADNPSKFLLYQDVMLGLFDRQIQGLDLSAHYKRLAEDLAGCRRENPEASIIFEYYEALARLLEQKAELGIKLCKGYHDGDREFLEKAAETVLPACVEWSEKLLTLRRRLWMRECKVFGFEVLDIRLAGVKTRLLNAQARIRQYLSGEIQSLEELEEPRLVYSVDAASKEHVLCSSNFWQNLVSAGNIAGI